jgi:hypothetical protein
VASDFQTVKELCPNRKVMGSFEIKAGAERVNQYLVIKDKKAEKVKSEKCMIMEAQVSIYLDTSRVKKQTRKMLMTRTDGKMCRGAITSACQKNHRRKI